MPHEPSATFLTRLLLWSEALFAFITVGWLLLAALSVRLEYYDGYDAILNARYFTGQITDYCATRGPLLGLLLTPAEWIRQAAGLHSLDVRPHHGMMALIHGLFFYWTYILLSQRLGRSFSTLLAFIAAVPTFIVISYLPFVSHDIYPGVILLAMVIASQRFIKTPDFDRWLLLVLLGVAAAATKHVLGLFWVAILLCLLPEIRSREAAKYGALLITAALTGGLLTWLMMGLSLASVFPDSAWWLRAFDQLAYLSGPAHDHSREEPWWVYIRNIPAFGLTAMLLVLPGLWFSIKGNAEQRLAARTWLVLAVIMHLLPLRQVRYLAFLGPLTAYIIQPVIQKLLHRKAGVCCILSLLVIECLPIHPYSRIAEASRIALPFYRDDVAGRFLAPVENGMGGLRVPVHVNWRMLSFAPDRESPLKGDLYHDLFHFGNHHLYFLYGMKPGELITLTPDELAALYLSKTHGSLILSSPGILIHHTTWRGSGTENKSELRQSATPLPLVAEPNDNEE